TMRRLLSIRHYYRSAKHGLRRRIVVRLERKLRFRKSRQRPPIPDKRKPAATRGRKAKGLVRRIPGPAKRGCLVAEGIVPCPLFGLGCDAPLPPAGPDRLLAAVAP